MLVAPAVQGLLCCCVLDIAHEDDCTLARCYAVASYCVQTLYKEAEVSWDYAQTGAMTHVAMTKVHCASLAFDTHSTHNEV